nr:vegetative cell wall protein gp1-like [Aegilops tauschii subsp. strangulata]
MEAPCARSFTSSRSLPRAVPVFAHPQARPRLKTAVPAPASPSPTGSSIGLRRASSPPTRAATTSPDRFSGLALTGPPRPPLPNPYRPCELPLSSLPCAPYLSPALGSAVARGQPHPSNLPVPRPRVSLRHPTSGLLSTPAAPTAASPRLASQFRRAAPRCMLVAASASDRASPNPLLLASPPPAAKARARAVPLPPAPPLPSWLAAGATPCACTHARPRPLPCLAVPLPAGPT